MLVRNLLIPFLTG